MRFDVVAFDLDGTLLDSTEGITRSILHALDRLGLEMPPVERLTPLIGPPLPEMLAAAGVPPDRVDVAVGHYRERYRDVGVYENAVYTGVPELLDALSAEGRRLLVATSKPEPFAEQALEASGLADRFAVVGGATFDRSRTAKADVLRHALDRVDHADPATAVIVGDREHDLIGGRAVGTATIGVTWGFGSRDELETHRPLAVVDRPDQITTALD